ncbi:hypothetical protein IW140_005660 [Coemansia sp. RSA 1813]|nr:hypothetical protein EV178_005244 [Coemansia sp. RSA 1646]KAJ1767769.1 hypothetical protein LPJ74_005197 [Coemansia sp. RSA 1843]KAJ2087077.1 hypothetical protein IW138_005234 [Coemansia sp. RSA 986]KAJ2212799.1 hypothetical protein EV179_004366 [Coemansia sp. RSA 487]KAJ2564635.1 hypothetical protein IW140_005660 [Coemansia sp. RSA 1813]
MATVIHDSKARKRVLWGTVGLATVGSVIGLNMSILKNLQPIRRHTLTMTTNWAIYGFFFFSVREALLHEQKKRNDSMDIRFSLTRDSDEMFSSLISGSLAGGTISFMSRKTKNAALSGALFFGLASAAGQYVYTKINRRRQAVILEKMALREEGREEGEGRPKLTDLLRGKLKIKAEDQSDSMIARLRRKIAIDPISLLPEWFPMRRLSSDEYHRMLLERKQLVFEELEQLRLAIADMKRREESLLQRLNEKTAH